jgi:hypothetical protein
MAKIAIESEAHAMSVINQDEENERRRAHERARELARKQGVKPIRNIEDLHGDFWPEEESVDEFLEWVRTTRQQDKDRSELEQL